MLWRTVGSVPSLSHIFSAFLELNVFILFHRVSVSHFIINETVFARLEILIQTIFDVDYFLILRGALAVVLPAARTSLI